MDTLFSNSLTRFWRVIKKSKKIIIGLVLFGFVMGSAPVQVQTVHAQASATNNTQPLGYDTANAIDKGVDQTVQKYSGAFADTINGVFESVGRFFANIFLLFARLLLKIATFFIDFIMVIAGYNGYIDSTAVNVGWTVVRDITNMLFIVILLVIAFATILGLEGYEWKQLLPKLLMAAILVNFSRTICGLLIDASQVIMITFLNAVSATIGGNIINAFRLPTFEAFHPNVQAQQLTSSGIMSAAALAFVFSGLVTATLGAYIFILGGRLIRLWILIVLSPLAFVLGVLPSTSGMASSWWSEMMDNLVTGPVIMFFIWLSLIVVGTGQANQELIRGSKMADTSPIDQAFGLQEQTATPTDIGSWNNLANFVIAIGMLFAGAKVASSIGGSSGNLLEAGLDYGKKVALAGIGYGLIRRAAGGAHAGARGIAGRVSDWGFGKVMAPVKRAGQIAGAALSGVGSDFERARNKKAQEIETRRAELDKRSAEGKGGRFDPLKSVGMRVMSWAASSEGRLDKNVKNWQALAEEKKKQVEETYGVSGWQAGTLKARESVFTKKFEAESAAGKRKKEAETQKSFTDGINYISTELAPLNAALKTAEATKNPALIKAATDNLEDMKRSLMNPESSLSVHKKFAGDKKVDPRYLMDYYNLNSKQIKSEADAQELEHISHNAMKMAVAEQRDELQIKEGKPRLFVNEERERQLKERRDLLGKMNHDTAMEQVKDISKRLRANRAKLTALGTSDPAESHHLQEINAELVTSMADIQALNAARGPGDASIGLREANDGFKPVKIDANDVLGSQAQELSALLQREVEVKADKIKEAFDELRKIKGDEFDAFMSVYSDSLSAVAGKGSINKAGLWRGELDGATKKMVYRPTTVAKDSDWIDGRRNYAINQSRAALSTMENFDDSLDKVGVLNPTTGKMMQVAKILSAESKDRIVKLLADRTKEQIAAVNGGLTSSLKKKFDELKARDSVEHTRLKDLIVSQSSTENRQAVKDYLTRLSP